MIDKNLLKDASEFLNIPITLLEESYNKVLNNYPGYSKWQHITSKEWVELKINQKDQLNVFDFYKNTLNYIPECIEYHSGPKRKELINQYIKILKKYKCKEVVDYGCGIGQDSIIQSQHDITAIACDIPGMTYDFAKWRFNKYKFNIEALNIKIDSFPLKKKYDAITCFEVLQHVPDPVSLINNFYSHIKKGGLFITTMRFNNNYILALNENKKYQGKMNKIIEKIGFTTIDQIYQWGGGNRTKYLEIYQK